MRLLVGNLAAAEQGVFNLLVNGESSGEKICPTVHVLIELLTDGQSKPDFST